jgi:hypothetical protein
MRLTILHDLQFVFDVTNKLVGVPQGFSTRRANIATLHQRVERR